MLDVEPSNASRLRLLQLLEQHGSNELDASQKQHTLQWTADEKIHVLKTLQKPRKTEQGFLISIANTNGGIEYMKDQ